MNLAKVAWILPLLSLSYDVPDSTESRVGFSAGGGSYSIISRDCSGKALSASEVSFTSASGFYEQRMDEKWWLGVTLDYFSRNGSTPYYDPLVYYGTPPSAAPAQTGMLLRPYALMETDFGEFGIGASLRLKAFSYGGERYRLPIPMFRFRLGRLQDFYVSGSMGFNRPIVGAGGWYDLGVGFGLGNRSVLWVGIDTSPYQASGLLVKTRFPLAKRLSLMGSGRYGKAGNVTAEYGFSLGVMYEFGR